MTAEALKVWEGKKVYAVCVQHGPFELAAHTMSYARFMFEAGDLVRSGQLMVHKDYLQPLDYRRSWHAQNAVYGVEGVTHVFYFDADMDVSLADITALLAHGKDVVSGTYFKGGVDTKELPDGSRELKRNFPCVAARDGKNITRQAIAEAIEKRELLEVDLVGGGCLLVTAETLYAIGQPAFLMDFTIRPGMAHITYEDGYFSRLCGMKGITIWMDPLVCPDHYKMIRVGYALRDMAGTMFHVPPDEPTPAQIRIHTDSITCSPGEGPNTGDTDGTRT